MASETKDLLLVLIGAGASIVGGALATGFAHALALSREKHARRRAALEEHRRLYSKALDEYLSLYDDDRTAAFGPDEGEMRSLEYSLTAAFGAEFAAQAANARFWGPNAPESPEKVETERKCIEAMRKALRDVDRALGIPEKVELKPVE